MQLSSARPRELADRMTDQLTDYVLCSRGGRPRSSLILISITNPCRLRALISFLMANGLWPTRSTACDPRATGVGGVCRRIRPPTSSLYSVLADLIRTQILQLAPGPQLQGDKTHTQHPNFSLPAEWEDQKFTTSVVDCDLTAHCCTTALHVSRADPVVSTWECRQVQHQHQHHKARTARDGEGGPRRPVELDCS